MAKTSFCHECGEEVASDYKYCPECGADLTSRKGETSKQESQKKTSFGDTEENFYSEKILSEGITRMLYEDDEEVVGILGEGYLENILGGGNVSRSTMILSNKRVYQKGKRYFIEDGEWNTKKGTKVLSVDDVVGTSFTSKTGYKKILLYSVLTASPFVILIPIISPIVGVIFYYTYKKFFVKRLFTVEYSGGAIGVDIEWYDEEEVEYFGRRLFEVR